MLTTPSFSDFNVTKHTKTLSNGVNVTLFERPKTPITIEIAFLSGSRFDPVGKEGLAHFTEHMVCSGTTNFPSGDYIAEMIGGMGGNFNASTSLDRFRIYIDFSEVEDFSKVVFLLKDLLNNPLFDSTNFENERNAIIREFSKKESNPGSQIKVLSRELLYQDTPCSRPTLGTLVSIKSITLEDVISYFTNMLTTGRASIIISGGISIDNVVKYLEEDLNIRSSEKFEITENLPIIRNKTISIKPYTTNDQLNIEFGFRACPKYIGEDAPLILLRAIMGSGFSSALYKKLRLEKGLVYSLKTAYEGHVDSADFTVNTEIAKNNLNQVLGIITEEFNRTLKGEITNKELDLFKRMKINAQKIDMQTSASWVSFHSYNELIGNENKMDLPDFLKEISLVTLEDITKVSNKYLTKNSWYLAICGDVEQKDIILNY